MEWKDKKVLVTDGAGFIGSHLAESLLELGAKVHIADNFSRGEEKNIGSFLDKIYSMIQRVGKSYFVQTPSKYFPTDSHYLMPLFQFLPKFFATFNL